MNNIIENNKLIAEFMGFQPTSLGWFDNEEHLINVEKDNTFDDLKFHKDWNWLMEVAEKCLTVNVDVEPINHYFIINDALLTININEVYNACVEFIKWYNNKNI